MNRIPFTEISEVVEKLRSGSAAVDAEEVRKIIDDVRIRADDAVRFWSEKFDETPPEEFKMSDEEIERARERLPSKVLDALLFSADSIRTTAERMMENLKNIHFDFNGLKVSVEFSPVGRVLCYAPGGRFSLASSLLMSAVTARTAGVPEVYATSPNPSQTLLAAASVAGVKALYRLGGAQALAAFAFGTETIPKVDTIVGPGNIYITEAKRQLFGTVGIDTLAGPSELLIIADGSADALEVALDLLAQAEHSPDSLSALLTTEEKLVDAVERHIDRILKETETPNWLREKAGRIPASICGLDEAVGVANGLAPEHIELLVADPPSVAKRLSDYGALFCGYGNSAVFGDYSAATNHILPTGGAAKFTSALSPLTFLRLRYQTDITDRAKLRNIAEPASELACTENLTFHRLRAEKEKDRQK